jgi:hypothetical protein
MCSGEEGWKQISRNDGKSVWDASHEFGNVGAHIFGDPLKGKFAFLVTGHHLTIRCDGDTEEGPAFGGTAMRRQVTLTFGTGPKAVAAHVLMYVPAKATAPVPAFAILNFQGNQAITTDPAVALATSWLPNDDPGVVDHRATEKARGTETTRFPVDLIVSRGYALVTAYYGDFDPDFDDGFQNGVQPLFYKAGQSRPAEGEWGAIGAWAWGLSRALDYLEKEQVVDATKVALVDPTSTAIKTRGLMRICPGLASSQSRDATLDTVPMAA